MPPQDVFDQIAPDTQQPPPPAPPPAQAPAQAASPPAAAGDVFDQVEAQNKQQTDQQKPGIADAQQGWWNWTKQHFVDDNEWFKQKFTKETEAGKRIVEHEIAQAHPWRAALAQFYYGSLDDAAKFGLQFTDPKNLALQVAGAARLKSLKLLATAANIYFAYRGGQELFGERQANESQADYLQRALFGAAGLTAGAGGAMGGIEETANLHKQQTLAKLGLSGDLAGRVQAKVNAAEGIRQKAALENAQATSDVMDESQQIKLQAASRMGQVIRDASHAVYSENARVSKLFDDLSEKLTGPVSDAPTIRAKILDTLKDHGIQDQEIPPKIFNAIPKRGIEEESVRVMGAQIEPGSPLYERLRAQGAIEERTPVNFKDLTRIRTDLWDAAAGARDGVVSKGLYDAYDSITQMQQDFAASKGVEGEYQSAKDQYKTFKRELGSGLMSDFLRASDFQDQAMSPRIAKIMTGSDAEALRGLLKIAGVDVTPLDTLTGGKRVAGAVKELQTTAAKKAAGITKTAETEARAIGKRRPIIPGRSDFDFVGKSTEQIRAEAMEKLSYDMKAKGISNPMALFMLLWGSIRLGMGSPFGLYPAGRGGASLLKGKLLRNTSYQDWIIRESGVDPTNQGLIDKLRKGLDRMSRYAIAPAAVGAGEKNAPDQTGTSSPSD